MWSPCKFQTVQYAYAGIQSILYALIAIFMFHKHSKLFPTYE